MQNKIFCKSLVIGIIALFIGVAVQPGISTATVQDEKPKVNVKDYLFQTIIDISDNPKVKEFFDRINQSLFTYSFDYKYVYLKILLKKPSLLNSILFTKPRITTEYLENNYNNGIELANLLDEQESLKVVESVKISDPELLNELKNIIVNDKELSNRITNLKEMNNNLKSNLDFRYPPIICRIINISFHPLIFAFGFLYYIVPWLYDHNFNLLGKIFENLLYIVCVLIISLIVLFVLLGCLQLPSS